MAYRDSVYIDEEKLLRIEAEGAIKEIAFAVNSVEVSSKLPNTDDVVYLNLTTKEDERFCVELTVLGFRVSIAAYND